MGHRIEAIICKPSNQIDRLAEFDLTVLKSGDFVIIPMCPYYSETQREVLVK